MTAREGRLDVLRRVHEFGWPDSNHAPVDQQQTRAPFRGILEVVRDHHQGLPGLAFAFEQFKNCGLRHGIDTGERFVQK